MCDGARVRRQGEKVVVWEEAIGGGEEKHIYFVWFLSVFILIKSCDDLPSTDFVFVQLTQSVKLLGIH